MLWNLESLSEPTLGLGFRVRKEAVRDPGCQDLWGPAYEAPLQSWTMAEGWSNRAETYLFDHLKPKLKIIVPSKASGNHGGGGLQFESAVLRIPENPTDRTASAVCADTLGSSESRIARENAVA